MSSFWSPSSPDKRSWQPIKVVQGFYKIRFLINIVLLVLAAIGLVQLLLKAQSIPVVYVTSETGRISKGKPVRFQMSEAIVTAFLNDVIAALFTRTQNGRVIENMTEMVDPLIIQVIDRPFLKATITEETSPDTKISPYTVRLIVLETKIRSYQGGRVAASFKTLITTQSADSYANSIVYFDTRWDKVATTQDNPLGFLLTGITVSTEDLFNRDEIMETIQQRTALVSEVPLPSNITPDDTSAPTPAPQGTMDPQTQIGVTPLGEEN